jgi:hypothetical protein
MSRNSVDAQNAQIKTAVAAAALCVLMTFEIAGCRES